MIGAAIGIQIITDPYVSDYDQVRRTWRERLFSWPWQPFVKFKTVYSPKYYKIEGNKILCSPQSAAQLQAHLASPPESGGEG